MSSKSVFDNGSFGQRVSVERHDQPGAERPGQNDDEPSGEPKSDHGFKPDSLWHPDTGYGDKDYVPPTLIRRG